MPRITPNLWFDTESEEAAEHYVSIFPNSKDHQRHPLHRGRAARGGTVLTVDFELDGQPFTAINGGPEFTFSEAISFLINCADQDEIDYYWEKLSDGGEEGAVRLAEGPLRPLVAGRARGWDDADQGPRPGAPARGDDRHVRDEEARHRGPPGRRRRPVGTRSRRGRRVAVCDAALAGITRHGHLRREPARRRAGAAS